MPRRTAASSDSATGSCVVAVWDPHGGEREMTRYRRERDGTMKFMKKP
jgi:hypothetical protein